MMKYEERQQNREYWEQQVAAYRSSGLRRKVFCHQNQIKTSKLDYWCRKLKTTESNTGTLDQENRWVPLRIREESGTGCNRGVLIRIGRVELTVETGFDPSTLSKVLRVVTACCI